MVAMEAGWVTTDVGRQPWIVYGLLRTEDAVSPAAGLHLGVWAVSAIYVILTALTIVVLRRLAASHRLVAPRDPPPVDREQPPTAPADDRSDRR
nr:cytochrome ubiquinol oxidase subunit I [Pseudonocardia saturnea]